MNPSSIIHKIFCVALIFFGSSLALAQDNKLVFEEVLVTAEKRSESLQDLSQAITVLSGQDLDNLKLRHLLI
jgi:iron complex outermembrane receptor protein